MELTRASPAVHRWRRRRGQVAILQLLGSAHPAVVLALPDVEQGGRGGRSRSGSGSGHLRFVLHLLTIGLTLGVGVSGVSRHD